MAAPRVLLACRGRPVDREASAGLCGVVTVGQQRAASRQALRRLGARIERACDELRLRKVVLSLADVDLDPAPLVEGMLLRAHASTEFVPDEESSSITQVTICVDRAAVAGVKACMAETVAIAESTNFARALADLPANVGTPQELVTRAKRRSETDGVRATVVTAARAKKLGMGLFSAVAAGSGAPGSILVLEHNASRAQELRTLVLLGKGVTHDTGGYNLKRSSRLHELTYDKAGAAAVIGAMHGIARLEVPLHVVGVAPLVENCIGSRAYKPGDILTALDGTTVYVENTDAEGRLLLADCLTWVSRFSPDLVIDIATLTAASTTAIGPSFAALFANDDDARALVVDAGHETGELLWPMPIHADHEVSLRHHLARMRNVGTQAGAASVAAAFLRHFTDYPWAHVDMAGRAFCSFEGEELGVGATGFGTRLLIRCAQTFAGSAAPDQIVAEEDP